MRNVENVASPLPFPHPHLAELEEPQKTVFEKENKRSVRCCLVEKKMEQERMIWQQRTHWWLCGAVS